MMKNQPATGGGAGAEKAMRNKVFSMKREPFRPDGGTRRVRPAPLVATMLLGGLLGATVVLSSQAPARIGARDYRPDLSSIGATASGSYLAGRQALQERDYEVAARLMERALGMDASAPGLVRHALALYISTGNWTRAHELAKRIVRSQPRHRLARMVLGLMAVQRHAYEEARRHFVKAAFTPLGILSGGVLAAWTWLEKPDLNKGLEALKALEAYPSFSGFKVYHEALMADFAGQPMRAKGKYAKALTDNPGSMRLVYAYGNFLRRRGKAKEAIALYKSFLKKVPENEMIRAELARTKAAPEKKPPPMIRKVEDGMAEALFSLTTALLDEHSLDSALLHAHMTLKLRPDLFLGWMLLGEVEENLGRLPQAMRAYAKVPREHPLYLTARLRIARILHQMGKGRAAIAELRRLSREFPNESRPFSLLADVLRVEKRWKEAAEAYTAAIRLYERRGRKNWRMYYNRGIAHERARMWDKAEKDFREALKIRPDEPSVLNYLGYSLIDRGERLQEALEMIRKAVQQRPNDGYIVDSLGWAYYKMGRYQDAVNELEEAVRLRPTDAVINDHLGDAYWKVGRKLEARFQWRHALDASPPPDPELEKKIRQKLAHGLEEKVPGKKDGRKQGPAPLANGKEAKPKG